jgi:hypothetical protein
MPDLANRDFMVVDLGCLNVRGRGGGMSENLKKFLAVGGLIAVFAAITLVRTRAALREVQGKSDQRTPEEWMRLLEVETFDPPLGTPRTAQRTMLSDPPTAPHLHLARLKLAGADERTERAKMKEGTVWLPIARKLYELGSNGFTFDEIEGPPNEEGRSKMVVDGWLLYSPPLEEPYASELGDAVCMVAEVSPGSPAEHLGLRQGDVLADFDHRKLYVGARGLDYPCENLPDLASLPTGQVVAFTVLRNGKPVELAAPKPEGKFGYIYIPAPVISPERLPKH